MYIPVSLLQNTNKTRRNFKQLDVLEIKNPTI